MGDSDPWVRGNRWRRAARRGSVGAAVRRWRSEWRWCLDSEHGGQVQGVGAVGEGFLELAVDSQALEGGGETAATLGQPVLADRPGGHCGLLVEDQVRVGGDGPAAGAVL